jgi:hypothetical protein
MRILETFIKTLLRNFLNRDLPCLKITNNKYAINTFKLFTSEGH